MAPARERKKVGEREIEGKRESERGEGKGCLGSSSLSSQIQECVGRKKALKKPFPARPQTTQAGWQPHREKTPEKPEDIYVSLTACFDRVFFFLIVSHVC